LVYILGHKPDKFGIGPDSYGFVSFKELLQVVHEEEGFGYVKRSHINEILTSKDRSLFHVTGDRIRVPEKTWSLDLDKPSRLIPKILFSSVRRKAYPSVIEKGLRAVPDRKLTLSVSKTMALRIGKRRDQNPILLEIMASLAQENGVLFYGFGEELFLSPFIPAKFISGPPIPKEPPPAKKKAARAVKEENSISDACHTPGSFVLDISKDPDPVRRAKGKKQKGWKEQERKIRKKKNRSL
jgi:putative RNA 2'-phosphotransferase